MFNGQDYHDEFNGACEKIVWVEDADEARSILEGVEWVLWEAIRGAIFYCAIGIAALFLWPAGNLLRENMGWMGGVINLLLWALLSTAIYWFFRLVFWLTISLHVKGRDFGGGGL